MSKKVAFFDLDGTLIAPRFWNGSKYVSGFTQEVWDSFCRQYPETAYNSCRIVPAVLDYARVLKSAGYKIYVLTAAYSEYDEMAKSSCYNRPELKDTFDGIIFSKDGPDKVGFLSRKISSGEFLPEDCILVEDSFNTIWEATGLGINCLHISNIYSGLLGEVADENP